jgi:hypothetical protein
MGVLYVHIGFHKTGTTYLQRYFNKNDAVNLIDRKLIQEELLEPSPYAFDIKRFEKILSEEYRKDKVNVISDEELTGNIHSGGNGRSIAFEVIERLASIKNFEVKIIMLIRSQVDMIDSCYRQYIKKGGCNSFNQYINPNFRYRHRQPGFNLEHFKYDDIINHLYLKLGKENVYVSLYEQVKVDLDIYISSILSLEKMDLNIVKKANHSYSNLAIVLARVLNRFCTFDPICDNKIIESEYGYKLLRKFLSNVSKVTKCNSYIDNDKLATIRSYYNDSNNNTARLLDVDLSGY